MQLVYITTNRVSTNHVHGEVYSMQYLVMMFVSDLGQVCGFLQVTRVPPPMKLTAPYQGNSVDNCASSTSRDERDSNASL